MVMKHTWIIEKQDGSNYLQAILRFVLLEFCRIFGTEIMYNEVCSVYNDPQADCPMLITCRKPICIRLAQENLSYWAQTIFQLSHELCHYAIRQRKGSFKLSWFEEILCEGMSLYILDWAYKNWDCCDLSQIDHTFSQKIQEYLEKELRKVETDTLQYCIDLKSLEKYELNSSTNRESHRKQRNTLYREIINNPLHCRCFCDYSKYISDNHITIDFIKWKKETSHSLIRVLHSFQPIKE